LLKYDSGFHGICQAELKQAWGVFLTELGDRAGGWDWWATLTFRDPPESAQNTSGWTKIGWKYSGKAFDTFVRELGLRKGLHDVWWVRGREYQRWRGVPHFHALIGGVGELRRLTMMDWWFDRYGIARIEPYDRSLGAGFYLCKYVTKELGDIQFSENLTMK
jgi:hypothetical protein